MIEQVMDDGFRRCVEFRGAFDRRHRDPNKNYGIHGMELRFVLIGPRGATQFLIYTNLHLPHVRAERFRAPRSSVDLDAPMGADIGYHARDQQYPGQPKSETACEYIGGECYYDGSGLRAEEFLPDFLAGGDDPVWAMLREEYNSRFVEDSTHV